MDEFEQLASLTADIVCAFVANNRASPDEVSNLVTSVGQALWEASNPIPVVEPEVQAKRSYSRRQRGLLVGQGLSEDQSNEIVDEQEAEDALIDEATEGSLEDKVDGYDPEVWDGNGAKAQPEPMFED